MAQRNVFGLWPIDLQTRYNLPSGSNGAGQIVAIVDAYDNPNVASDLAAYFELRSRTINFTKYNQNSPDQQLPAGSAAGALRSISTSRSLGGCEVRSI
jgi:hypothetical protein